MSITFLFICFQPSHNNGHANKKKKGQYTDYVKPPENAISFLFDVETTDSKRNWDRIIAVSFLAYDTKGMLLDW